MAELLIVNPSPRPSQRKKGAKKTMATKKRRSAAQRAATARLVAFNKARRRGTTTAKHKPAKRRKYARNPTSVVYASGPKKGKSVSRASWRKSGYRRNPIKRAGGMLGNIVNDTLIPAATAAGGAIALDIAYGFLPIPATLKTGPLRHVVKGAGAIALGMVAGMVFSKKTAQQMSLGAMTVVTYNAYRDMLAQFAPQVALGAYLDEPIPSGNGMGAYIETQALTDESMSGAGDYGMNGAGDYGLDANSIYSGGGFDY